MGLTASKWQMYFMSASAIAVVNSGRGAAPRTTHGALRGRSLG
jgi:hypothetical protein